MPLTGEYEPSPEAWVREQVATYEATDGREGAELRGAPVVVLTTKGRRSGALRKQALMRVEYEGSYAVVASLGGAPKNPVWYWNALAEPLVELQDGADRHDYLAREVSGEEKAQWWARAVEVWPDYDAYQAKTDREIPVLVLERTP